MRRHHTGWHTVIPLCLCCAIMFGWCEYLQAAQDDVVLQTIQEQIIALRKEFKLRMEQSRSDRQATYENIQLKIKDLIASQSSSNEAQPELITHVKKLLPILEAYGKQIDKLEQMVTTVESETGQTLDSIKTQLAVIKQQGIPKSPRLPRESVDAGNVPEIDSENGPETVQAQPSPLDLAPGKLFRLAYGFFRQGEYDVAIGGFQKFLIDFPDSELAGAAQYWIAESFNKLEEYDLAIQEYSYLIQTYPRDAKIGDAHYGIGIALLKLGRTDEARQKFQYVADHFGGTISGQKAQKRLGEL